MPTPPQAPSLMAALTFPPSNFFLLKEPYLLANISTKQFKDKDLDVWQKNLTCTLEYKYFDMSS